MTNKETESKQRKKFLKKISYYKNVFDNEDGKKVLYDLMKHAKLFSSEYQPDPSFFIFKEGRRDAVNYILTQLKWEEHKILELFTANENEELDDVY